MSHKKDTVAPDAAGQGGSSGQTDAGPARLQPAKPIELLNEREFRERFNIPNGMFV